MANKISDIFNDVGVGVIVKAYNINAKRGLVRINKIDYEINTSAYLCKILDYIGNVSIIFNTEGNMKVILDSNVEKDITSKLEDKNDSYLNEMLKTSKENFHTRLKSIENQYSELDELRKSERYKVKVVLWISHKGKDKIDEFYNASFQRLDDGRILVNHEEGEALYEKDKFQRVYREKYVKRDINYDRWQLL